MPTVLKRVMLYIPEDTHAQLEKIAKLERRSMAKTCLVMVEAAMKLPKYRELLETKLDSKSFNQENMNQDG